MIESKRFPGFFEIPGYSRYVISRDGIVLNIITNSNLSGSVNPDRYHNFRLMGDNGYTMTFGRHHLLALVFIEKPVSEKKLIVNHIDGIKGSDNLKNLEWVTYKENAEHAGLNGLTSKCKPVSVRDCIDGVISKYPSYIECAKALGLSKDAIVHRLKFDESRVFPEQKQYRHGHDDLPWTLPLDLNKELMLNGTEKPVLVKFLDTDEVLQFDKISDMAHHLSISQSTCTMWLSKPDQPVHSGNILVKYAYDISAWRDVKDPEEERRVRSGWRAVKVVHKSTDQTYSFESAAKCAKAFGITNTALNYRLKSNGNKVFSDGLSFSYMS